ncbi:MAG: tRNA guanosine(15) transglycosylase TgtA [Desulfurococcaceae archaeon]
MEHFEARDFDLAGRIGVLRTRHGNLETPYIFPVVDPRRQAPPLQKIAELGFRGVITNAYLLLKRTGAAPLKVHEVLGWDGIVMTDSGGYQILSYGDVDVNNKQIVGYQMAIGSDIGVILDIPTGSAMSFEEAEGAVDETLKRAVEALPLIMQSDQLWALPVQGAPYLDLLTRAAARSAGLPYHIYAIGSPTVLLEKYDYERLVEYVAIARALLPPHKPIHVFGVGHPMIIPYLVALGADLFDSASYILYARDNRYMTEWGTKDLRELSYFPCNCPVCSRYTPQELLEMGVEERTELLALHNLHALAKEIRTVKEAIREGRLWELLEGRSKAHPSLRRAFEKIKEFSGLLARGSSLNRPPGFAALLFDRESLSNPVLSIARESAEGFLRARLARARARVLRLCVNVAEKPAEALVRNARDGCDVILDPFLGVVAPALSSSFPFYQHERGVAPTPREFVEMFGERVLELLRRANVQEVVLRPLDGSARALVQELRRLLEGAGFMLSEIS